MSVLFAWPAQTQFGRILPKQKIYQHGRPSQKLRDRFVAGIERIIWAHKLAPKNLNLSAVAQVPEIEVLQIIQKQRELDEDLLRIIDRAIPQPLFYELHFDGKVMMRAAYKRPHERDSGKWLVGEYFHSEWFRADSERTPLPVSLDLGGLYEQMLRVLIETPARNGESLQEQVERIRAIRHKAREVERLEAGIRREKQFNRKVAINRELRAVREQLQALEGE